MEKKSILVIVEFLLKKSSRPAKLLILSLDLPTKKDIYVSQSKIDKKYMYFKCYGIWQA